MAIDDLLDEHEQGERVRTWLRENGAGLIGGVILGLAVIGGWQWWQKHRDEQRLHIGEQFQVVTDDLTAKKLKQAQQAASALPSQSPYATLAALGLAKAQVDAGQRDAAIATLRGAQPKDAALSAVVDMRLAKLLIDAGKPADALARLPQAGANAGVEQVRGDALFALGKRDEARAAYARALAQLDVGDAQRLLIELKLSQVGGTPAKPEASS